MKAPKSPKSPTHSPVHGKHIMGSMRRIHRNDCLITNAKTGEKIDDILLS